MKRTSFALMILMAGLPKGETEAASSPTGFYIGADFGYKINSARGGSQIQGAGPGMASLRKDLSLKGFDGILGGGHMGFQYRTSNCLLLGVEVAGDFSKLEGKYTDANGPGQPSWALKSNINKTFQVSGRLGYAYKNFFPYIKAGFISSEIKTKAIGSFGAATLSQEVSHRRPGFVLGLGAGTLISEQVILGAEYNYSVYRTRENRFTFSNNVNSLTIKDNPQFHTFIVKLSFKFW